MKLITVQQQADSAAADLAMYRTAMPEMVKSGKTSQAFADYKISTQEAIVHTLNMMLPPKGVTQGTLPVVLHFATEEDRAAYLKEMNRP